MKQVIPPKYYGVGKNYRFDWQFAIDRSKLPLLRPASLIIGLMPLLKEGLETLLGQGIPVSFWVYWIMAVSFLISWSILSIYCPKFVQEYRDFGTYRKRHHSHRWIVWEFYNNIKKLSSWKFIIGETLFKEIAFKCNTVNDMNACRLCPTTFENLDEDSIDVFKPVNEGRDIFLPINLYGERVVLALQERDPELKEKEKELFWILYTQAAKEGNIARFFFWFFFYTSLALIAFNVLKNVYAFIF